MVDSYTSALYTLPVVLDCLPKLPHTILDVGCDDGQWLRAAHELLPGLVTYGVDCKQHTLLPQSPTTQYTQVDLNDYDYLTSPTHPPQPPRYDLVICVEVAEHLQPGTGPFLVYYLAARSDTILFSGATPGQGPYDPIPSRAYNSSFHYNEHPHSYWHRQFQNQNYTHKSLHRALSTPRLLPQIDPWYRNNMFLYTKVR